MKVLLVDDGGRKFVALRNFLSARADMTSVELSTVENGHAARRAIRNDRFDLLILDVLLPWRAGGEPSNQGSLNLLDSITSDQGLLPPRQVVGLSADPQAAADVAPIFSANTWTVLHYDETSSGWMEAIGASILYLAAQQAGPATYDTDVLVLTALREPEMSAVHRLPWAWQSEQPLDDATFIRRGNFRSGEESFSVVTAVAERMGMVSTGVLAAKVISYIKPRYCVMVGICAGLEAETRFGDAVLADPAWDYQSGKRIKEPDGSHVFKVDPHQLPISQFVRSRFKQLALDTTLLASIRQSRDDDPGHDLRLLVGPMATGSAVIADPKIIAEIKDQQHRKVIAIEMEAYGLYAAANNAGAPKPTAFALKSVSDFADAKKEDSAQRYAAFTSAKLMQVFFERYMPELRNLAGS